MCGIVGYIGSKNSADVVLHGLKKLEYRGYDSAGIAVVNESGDLDIRHAVGKILFLEDNLRDAPLNGFLGIGHTRWATHGEPCLKNAHPQVDCTSSIAVVHNGIIENYLELKENLLSKGHIFKSDTDTEVIAHLVEDYQKTYKDTFTSFLKALNDLRGVFAIALINSKEPDKIFAARQFAPLILGRGDGENFLASDIPAILKYTKSVYIMKDGEVAVISRNEINIFDMVGNMIKPNFFEVKWNEEDAEKGGFDHFMLKEISEQPLVVQETIGQRVFFENEFEPYKEELPKDIVRGISRICFVACGTSYHAALIGKFLMEYLADMPCEVDYSSEFRYRNAAVNNSVLTIAISQSGETADTLAAMREAKKRGSYVLAITNRLGSTANREADFSILTRAGLEIGVAATKTFTSQLVTLYILALYMGSCKRSISKKILDETLSYLLEVPKRLEEYFPKFLNDIEKSAKIYSGYKNMIFMGRGINYPVALEGALKLKEISYIHAEGYPAGEMKHGPIALLDPTTPVLAIATRSAVTYEKVLSNIEEAKSRRSRVVALISEGDKDAVNLVNDILYVPDVPEIVSPIYNVVPLQLFAYYAAVWLSRDPDKPRNLAKSVTVE
ncbi:Glucosamine--fructose-6-phosphate aminotransferase (isomerizing) [Thermodesulfobium narugense DSM 14796]|uniref:Glutamine--fructose-6-phosphate aminotransferase [isomerizing] n=1 Tax=Thermodesulfobium narugense DSM 14796 TaxID=747365 RepID=M1E8E2_9BACT|nr:glutamine--fructose-6-phosphate transaminase (isomerizing) [Thermodesulfobium narugense]AEE14424.1 Glucosamine--fructose-6-phosphate aminotransferase (isomerizing) [Thermodesulfobium narugense DSM 14796]